MRAIVLVGVCLLAACDTGEEGPVVITTGATLAATTAHWASNPCIGASVKVAFADDGTGTQDPGFGAAMDFSWTQTSATTVTLAYAAPCTVCLGSITDMSGGVDAGQLIGRGFRADGFSPNTCEFALIGGPVP